MDQNTSYTLYDSDIIQLCTEEYQYKVHFQFVKSPTKTKSDVQKCNFLTNNIRIGYQSCQKRRMANLRGKHYDMSSNNNQFGRFRAKSCTRETCQQKSRYLTIYHVYLKSESFATKSSNPTPPKRKPKISLDDD